MVEMNTNLNIRLSKELKDKLLKTAKDRNDNYSDILRTMILEYVRSEVK
jgi:predicted transcriptional regulator